MALFKFSEANVKKNYFRIFVKTAANIVAFPTDVVITNGLAAGVDDRESFAGTPGPLTSGMFTSLYDAYYEEIGSCNAEPKISSSDVEGITNNIGTKLGASKETTVEFVLNDLDGGTGDKYDTGGSNYQSLVGIDGTTVNLIFFDENTGTLYKAAGVSISVNLDTTGNSFENVPVTATKEATTIGNVVTRFKLVPGATPFTPVGSVVKYTISQAGDGYVFGGTANHVSVSPSVGSGFAATVAALGDDDGIYALTVSNAGTLYAVGSVITLTVGSGTPGVSAKITVTEIA